MKPIPWQRKPILFYCPACRQWIDDSFVSGDQVHDRTRGGCGEFVLTREDASIRQNCGLERNAKAEGYGTAIDA